MKDAETDGDDLRPTPRGEMVRPTRKELRVGVQVGEKGLRLDHYIAGRLRGLGRAYIRARIVAGDALVNGQPSKPGRRVAGGDRIVFVYGRDADVPLVAEDLPLSILHEDADLIVVDKPSGVPSQPRDRHIGGSLVNRLVAHLSRPGTYLAPRVVHRLDQDTSGVILYCKTEGALRSVSEQFRRRRIEKRYLALVEGRLERDGLSIRAPIGRHPTIKEQRRIVEGGKASVSHVGLVERLDASGLSLVGVLLETGRTHQIRLHLAHVGHPIVGDAMYGGRPRLEIEGRPLLERQALHAHRLGMTHPRSGKAIEFEAPLPADLEAALAALRAREGGPPGG